MPRPHNYYPEKIHHLLYTIGHDDDIQLAYSEVAFMLLREVLLPYGFDCSHPEKEIRKSPKDGQPYCHACFARLEEYEEQVLEQIKGSKLGKYRTVKGYRAKQTFLDIKRKENKQKLDSDYEGRVKAEVDTRIKALIEDPLRKEREKREGEPVP